MFLGQMWEEWMSRGKWGEERSVGEGRGRGGAGSLGLMLGRGYLSCDLSHDACDVPTSPPGARENTTFWQLRLREVIIPH